MQKRIAINGFGRIGRTVFRIIHARQKIQSTNLSVVAINDLSDIDMLAHLLKYDSVHGRFSGTISYDNEGIIVDGQKIVVLKEKDLTKLPWKNHEVDVVLESTGKFLSKTDAMMHVAAGAKKALISAPCKGEEADATICYGINHHIYKPSMQVISTASCTTNCIVPVAKVLNDQFGILNASVTTVHSYTNDQQLLDLAHGDKRRSRAAALSMIPTTTGAAKAVAQVLPELAGKFDGMSIRVPTPNVSLVDMVAVVKKSVTRDEVNNALKTAAEGQFKGIMGFSVEPLVSVDLNGSDESSIIDSLSTAVIGGNLVKVLSWYDNEWGFGNRAVDVLEMLATS